jgi:hypothetical protein
LRSTFPKGAVFVKNIGPSIRNGIENFFKNRIALKNEIAELKTEKRALWDEEVGRIEDLLS